MKKFSTRKALFIIVLVLILTLASLSAFASTPLAESVVEIYLPIISKAGCGTIPC